MGVYKVSLEHRHQLQLNKLLSVFDIGVYLSVCMSFSEYLCKCIGVCKIIILANNLVFMRGCYWLYMSICFYICMSKCKIFDLCVIGVKNYNNNYNSNESDNNK